jgi:membrane protease YdiL (CAAX protease family)
VLTLKALVVRPSVPLWQYCLLTIPIALFPSFFLAWSAQVLFASAGVDVSLIAPPDRVFSIGEFLGTTVFAPIVETALLALGLQVLMALSSNPVLVAVVSALIWGCIHGAFGFLWLFGTVWSFLVFSWAYLAWRPRSFRAAFTAAAVPHAAINTVAMLLIPLLG